MQIPDSMPRWSQVRPRYGSAIVALLGVGVSLGYAALQETPRGRLAGQVTRRDTGAPMPFARLTAYANAKAFYTRSDAKGRFVFAGLPAGNYDVSAYSRSHAFEGGSVKTSVEESETTVLPVILKRARPDLQLTQQEQVFLPGESVALPLHGYVDPAKSRNADVLQLRVWKTRLSDMMAGPDTAQALAQVASRWQPPATLPTILLKPAGAPAPKLIEERTVSISEADAEGFYHKRMPLAARGVGLYLTEVSHREGEKTKTVCAWINVTGTALVTKHAGSQTLAYVTDLKSGAAQSNFAVVFYRGGKKVGEAKTDTKGVALFSAPASDQKLMAVAQRGDDEAVLSRDAGEEENAGKLATHVYTDRPIYRPGQKISFKGISRRRAPQPDNSTFIFGDGHIKWAQNGFMPPAKTALGFADIEVRDPTGVRVLKTQKTLNNYGSFAGEVELSPEAPTGLYSLISTIDGEEHTTDITVASYRKPEFEVTVTPEKPRYVASDGMRMEIEAKYYFGAPVAGAKVSFEIYRDADWSSEYDRYDDEDLEGDESSGYGEFIRDGEGVLDENGHLTVNFSARGESEIQELQDAAAGDKKPDDPAAEQPQIYTAHVTVTDAAERMVEGEGKARLVAGDFGLSVQPNGYVAQPGQPMSLNIAARDYDDKPVPNQPIDLEIGYWRYEESKDKPNEGEESKKSNFVTVGTQKFVTNAQGVATGSIKLPRNGSFDLVARSTDRAGHLVRNTANIWAAGDEGGDFYGGAPQDLALFTDKKHYEAGDTARVLINSGKIGPSVLLTLEGERVYQSWVIPIRQASTVVRVPIKDEFGPNVYLAACYVKDKKFAQSEIPLRVHVAAREVKVAVRADKADYTPGAPATYQVTTTDVKGHPVPAEFSFGVVDESIYALAEDHPEELAKEFYPHRQNRVQTAHSFATEFLGDANKAALHIEPRKKFLDTAFWQPFEQTGADGTAKITFNLPDNLTKWRATAIAQTQDTSFGFVTQKVTASKDFYVRLEKPRFLTQRDNARLIAFVHNDTGVTQKATVRLDLEGLTTSDETTQSLTIEPGKPGQITWPVTVDAPDEAKITLSARTDGVKKFTDAVEETLPIHPHGRTVISGRAGEVSGDKVQVETVRLDAKALPSASRVTLRLTPSVVSSLTGGLQYLIGFPYGCVEQTMSRFLPDILVSRVLKQSGGSDAKSREMQAQLPAMVRDGLTRLYAMQHESGAWGWWEIDADNPWMTAYVLYGLATAREAGFAVDDEKYSRGRAAALTLLPSAKGQNRAFLLYALARSAATDEEKTKIFKERGKTNWNGWDGEALAYLILTDKLLNFYDPKAKAAFERRADNADAMVHWRHWSDPKRDELWEYDYDDITATAAGLRAVLAQNPDDLRVPQILRWLMLRRTGDHWESTRDTSFVLAALCDYLQARPGAATLTGTVSVNVNGQTLKSFNLSPQAGNEADLQVEIPGSRLKSGDNKITLARAGGGSPVFYSLQVRQIIAAEDIPALEQSKFKITREYLRLTTPDRSKKWEMSTEATNNVLRQGDSIRVKLTFEAPRDMAYVMIEDPFPAGCETTERGTANQEIDSDWSYGYSSIDIANIDVRDDRIAFFARKISAGKHTIEYHLRAQTPGVYHVLPAQVSPMYDPETRAETSETRVEVK